MKTAVSDYAIGIDLGGTNLRVGLVNRSGTILDLRKVKTGSSHGPAAVVENMARLVQEILSENQNPQICGIGIGSPGPLNRKTRRILSTANLVGFENFPLGDELESRLKTPVFLENDARAAAFGEKQYGAAKTFQNFILLTFGTGVGGGVFVNNHMMYGKSDAACELGHLCIHPGGLRCGCGLSGCMEAYVSASAIERRSVNFFDSPKKAPEIFQMFLKQDRSAQKYLKEITTDIAVGLGSLINIFDPEAIILGGGLFSSGGEPLTSMIVAETKHHCFSSSYQDLKIIPSALHGEAGILGAAGVVFYNML
jgi:glucokinase